jgi:surface carbohydrate biosynthesis protein
MFKEKIVLIPYEVESRDYKSRLLLSFFLAQAGFRVIFGRKAEVEYFTRCFSNSIYIGLQSTNTYLNFYKKVKLNNNKLILFDEEGLVTLSKKTYLKTKFSKKIATICDIFFCWGRESYKFLSLNRKDFKKKLVISGNLRFDILKKRFNFLNKKNSDLIKKKFRSYILVTCSFGNVNHYNTKYGKISFLQKNHYLNDSQSVKNYKYYLKYNKKKFLQNRILVKYLAEKFKDLNIIIRPHPSEKLGSYLNLKKKFSNVHVSKEFSIAEWLKWSKLNIHYYCTTSLEASAMGVENLAFKPDFNSKNFVNIPYLFSNKIDSLHDVEKFVKKILKKKNKIKRNKKIENHIYNFYAKYSYKIIINEIKKISKKINNKQDNYQSKINLFKKKLLNIKFVFKNFGNYTNYKASDLSYTKIKNDLMNFKGESKKKINVSKFQKNVFEIFVK